MLERSNTVNDNKTKPDIINIRLSLIGKFFILLIYSITLWVSINLKPSQKQKSLHGVIVKMPYNVGSYTQGRIAGDFLSSRNAAQAERCPPKTTAAALDG